MKITWFISLSNWRAFRLFLLFCFCKVSAMSKTVPTAVTLVLSPLFFFIALSTVSGWSLHIFCCLRHFWEQKGELLTVKTGYNCDCPTDSLHVFVFHPPPRLEHELPEPFRSLSFQSLEQCLKCSRSTLNIWWMIKWINNEYLWIFIIGTREYIFRINS